MIVAETVYRFLVMCVSADGRLLLVMCVTAHGLLLLAMALSPPLIQIEWQGACQHVV